MAGHSLSSATSPGLPTIRKNSGLICIKDYRIACNVMVVKVKTWVKLGMLFFLPLTRVAMLHAAAVARFTSHLSRIPKARLMYSSPWLPMQAGPESLKIYFLVCILTWELSTKLNTLQYICRSNSYRQAWLGCTCLACQTASIAKQVFASWSLLFSKVFGKQCLQKALSKSLYQSDHD